MKQDLVAGALGAALLGAVVVLAVLPGESAADPGPAEAGPAEQADDLGCRGARLALARQPLGEALGHVAEATAQERVGGDGLSFDDWYDADLVEPPLEALATGLTAAGQMPGASDAFFEADLAVVEAITRLLRAVDGTTITVPETIDDARLDLVQRVAELEETCA